MHRRAIALTLVAIGLAGGVGCKGKKKDSAAPAAGSGSQAGSALPTRPGPASPGNGIPPATDPDPGYEARRAELLRRGNPEMMKDAPVIQTTAPDLKPEQMIKQLGPQMLQIGASIKLDLEKGRAEMPARAIKLNSENAPLEYLAVAENGKIHESLLTITANAMEVRLALNLLGYEGAVPQAGGVVTDPTVDDTVLIAAIAGGKERPLSAYLIDRKTKKAPKDHPWQVISFRPEDRDQALLTKDFLTLVARDYYAPLRYTLDAGNPYEGPSTGYTTNTKLLPPGTDVTLVIKRRPEKQGLPAGLMPISPTAPGLPVPSLSPSPVPSPAPRTP